MSGSEVLSTLGQAGTRQSGRSLVAHLSWLLLALLLAFLAFLIAVALLSSWRRARRLRDARRARTPVVSAWEEAGRRLRIEPGDGHVQSGEIDEPSDHDPPRG